jgi:hypothetical protein
MGFGEDMDKLKKTAGEHSEQVDKGLDKAGDFADEKTGHQHTGQIDKGRDELEKQLGTGDQPDQR